MPRKRKARVYWKRGRAYGDFRDLGGRQEALVPEGETLATKDTDVAAKLASARVEALESQRRTRALVGIDRHLPFGLLAQEHLEAKAKAGRVTVRWLEETERRLRVATAFFGEDRPPTSIVVRDIEAYVTRLQGMGNGRGGTLSPGAQRHYLNAISNLFRRAQALGVVPPGHNPVSALMEKPTARHEEARWLEVHEAALVLEAARLHKAKRADIAQPYLYEILATFLLTGGRQSEVLGLCAEDISFDRGTVTFRPNEHRRLKTKQSQRSVPLFPQLREILQKHVFEHGRVSGLLFRGRGGKGLVADLRRALDSVGEAAGFAPGEIRTKLFRHTYCTAALQLVDRGAPISTWTVARWMGHGGQALVNRVYGHLGDVRHRSTVLEYRLEQHNETLGERLDALRGWEPGRCQATTYKGERCPNRPCGGDDFCRLHLPNRPSRRPRRSKASSVQR